MAENKVIIFLLQVFFSNFFGKVVDKAFPYKFRISAKR